MEFDYHICFSKARDQKLWQYVQDNHIRADHTEGEDSVAIDIVTDSPFWPWISSYMAHNKVFCLCDMVFSKEELQKAQWLNVRTTWRYGYPEPSSNYKYEDITYKKDTFCTNCGTGLEQVDSFRLKKAPKWGHRHFYAPFWIEDELFISETAKNLLQNSGLTGISFAPIKNKSGKDDLPETWQLVIPTVLENGLIEAEHFLKKITTCPVCGRKKYCANGRAKMIFRKSIFDGAPDLAKSGDYFGGMPKSASREILISQKAYRVITENKLDKGLLFYPIDLV